MSRARAIILTVVLVASLVGPLAGAGGATAAQEAPPGMVGVPSENVGPPEHAQGGGPPSNANIPTHASAWDIHSNQHAGTLEVGISTTSDGELMLNLTDEVNHAPREVALDRGTLREALGREPRVVHGVHESGEKWTSEIRYDGSFAYFRTHSFSTNEVTFDGRVDISATPAESGSQIQYDVEDSASVDDINVTLTGSDATAPDSLTQSDVVDGDQLSLTVGGTTNTDIDVTMRPTDLRTNATNTEVSAPTDVVEDVAVAGSGDIGLVGSRDSTGYVLDLSNSANPTVTAEISAPADIVRSVALNDAGDVGLLGSDDNSTYVLDLADPSNPTVTEVTAPNDWAESVSLNDAGDIGLVGSSDSTGYVLDLADPTNPTVTGEITSPASDVRSVTLNDAGDIGLLGTNDQSAYVVDLTDPANPSVSAEVTDPTSDVTYVALNDAGDIGLLGPSTSTGYVLDLADPTNPTVTEVSDPGSNVYSVALNGPGDIGLLGSGDNSAYVLDLADPTNPTVTEVPDPGDSVGSVALNDAGDIGLLGTHDNPDYVLGLSDPSNPTVSTVDTSAGVIYAAAIDDAGDVGMVGSYYNAAYVIAESVTDPSLTIDGQTASYAGTLSGNETHRETLTGVSTGSYSPSLSLTDGAAQVSLKWTETTETVDPSVTINSTDGTQTVDYAGTLADGQTANLSSDVDPSLIGGTVSLEIGVSESYSGPTGQVGLDYSHTAASNQTVEYGSEAWSERYNVSRTWVDDRSDASLTIPFASSRVVAIRDLEMRTNGSSWSAVSSSDYSLSGTTLEVDLGAVSADETTTVRANGTKVNVQNGEIDVLDPTIERNTLETRFEVVDRSSSFGIDVSGTYNGDRIHRLTNSSWEANESALVRASGEQILEMPDAPAGGSATVEWSPMTVTPQTGDARVSVSGPDTEPTIEVSQGDVEDDVVEFTFLDAADGKTYELYSQTHGVVRDSGTASSPLTLTDDDSAETLQFLLEESGSSSAEPVGAGVIGPITQDSSLEVLRTPLTVLTLAGSVIVLLVAWRRGPMEAARLAGGSVSWAARGTGRTLTRSVRWFRGHPIVGSVVLAGAGLAATATGWIPVPEGAGVFVLVTAAPVVSYLTLIRWQDASLLTWGVTTIVAVVVGLQLLGTDVLATVVDSEAFPLLIMGGLYLAYQALSAYRAEASTPDEQTTVSIRADGGANDSDDGGES